MLKNIWFYACLALVVVCATQRAEASSVSADASVRTSDTPHSADYLNGGNWTVESSELARIVELYMANEYHCDDTTADGYAPGTGDQSGPKHDADYQNGGNWRIDAPEVIRIIDLYETGSYSADASTADGFSPSTNEGRPEANYDTASVLIDGEVDIDVLANDFHPEGLALFTSSAGTPHHGSTHINDEDTVTYTPDAGYEGVDTFSYTVRDSNGATATAAVSVSVSDETALQISGVYQSYSSPYLLDYTFSLRDHNDRALILDPADIAVDCYEDDVAISPSETGYQLLRGATKQLKCVLVLDYSQSMTDVVSNGDSDGDGISDAVEAMESAAKDFIDALGTDTQVAIYEFHREDRSPMLVQDFTSDPELGREAIDSIWTDYINGPGASRCWDAVASAVSLLSEGSPVDEQRSVVFLSDGRDESSSTSPEQIMTDASAESVNVYSIGFGAELNPAPLTNIASSTGGQYYNTDEIDDLTDSFQHILFDLNGQYVLRWATLKRSAAPFTPSFDITAMGQTADYTAPAFRPTDHEGNVLAGSLRFVVDSVTDNSTRLVLRSPYIPRHIDRLRLYYDTDLPSDVSVVPAMQGGLCSDWTLTRTPDESGGVWLELTSPDTTRDGTASHLPYAGTGAILQWEIDGVTDTQNIFNDLRIDNTVYVQTGGRFFSIANSAPLDISNRAPTLMDDAVDTDEDTAVEVNVLANDSDPDPSQTQTLTIASAQNGKHGSVRIAEDGKTVTYTPQTGFGGTDHFEYTVVDQYGVPASAEVEVTVGTVTRLQIDSVFHTYSSPYLLDFSFSLRDQNDHALILDPEEITVNSFEDGNEIGAETGYQIMSGATKRLKCVLVLDYSRSMADTISNGDSDGDGISDAIEAMESAAKDFIDALNPDTQTSIYEFHRDDRAPELVQDFTTDRSVLKDAIDTIWTDHVDGFPAGSRCWDAVYAAVERFSGSIGPDQERLVVFLSDGHDESSSSSLGDIIGEAEDRSTRISCIGFGADLDATPLTDITSSTGGQYYTAADIQGLNSSFQQIIYDLQGQYLLRWATLKRSAAYFKPSFDITAAGQTAHYGDAPDYSPALHEGDQLVGDLRFVADPAATDHTRLLLTSRYTPRYIRRLRLYYHTDESCTVSLVPASRGGLCSDWTLSRNPDGPGGVWLELTSPNPNDIFAGAIPFAAMGPILQFDFQNDANRGRSSPDVLFNDFFIDNSVYEHEQSFSIANREEFADSNEPPVARDDTAVVNEESPTPLEIEVLANDLDPDPGQSLIVAAATDGEHGTVEITGDGTTVTYTREGGFTGTDSFTYAVSDQHGGTATAQVTVEVNRAPTPAADTAETTWETSVSIDVLANDTDPENDDLTLSAATQGNHGAVTLNGDTELTYTPNDTWLGEDQFSYTVVDEHGATATSLVTVTTVNQAPTLQDDSALTNKDTPLEIEVLANDLDPDPGQSLIVASVTDGEHGTVEITGDGTTVTYTPGEGFSGTDNFTYTVSDPHGGTATAQVTVEVNRAPTPVADIAETTWRTSVSIDVLANDTDPENDDLTLSAATQGNHGAVTLNGDTELTYTPNDTWLGEDQFSYTVVDEHGATATGQVTVTTVNQVPTARDDAAVVNEDSPTLVEIDVLANDSDPNPGQSLIVASVTDGEHGTVQITGDGTTATYTPGEGFTGTDSFTYTVSDQYGGTATARVAMAPSPERFVLVDGGTFTMGDTLGDGESREKPTHVVTVSSFHMSKYEATNQQVADVFQWAYDNGRIAADSDTAENANGNSQELLRLEYSDCQISFSDGTFSVDDGKGNYPCVAISWYGAAAYCNFLSEKEGLTPAYDFSDWNSCDWSANGYRLPTEAEWEYAARGGQEDTDPTGGDDNHKYAGSDENTSLDDVAWYSENSDAPGNSNFGHGRGTLPVGGKTPNELGLYDMTGNVWEWCWDWYDSGYYAASPATDPPGPGGGSDRLVRGGNYALSTGYCRVAHRFPSVPGASASILGVRLVLPVQVTVEVKQAPIARNDAALSNKDTPVEIDVLANDLAPDPGQSLIVASVTDGEHGTVQITGDGTTVTYTPGEGFTGTDSFTYTVSDQYGGTATARVAMAPSPEGFVLVDGGTFTMGDTLGDGESREKPTHVVTVSSFHMSKYEATNQQVADVFQWAYDNGRIAADSDTAENANGNSQELLDLDGDYCQISFSDGTFSVDDGKEDYPVAEISWYGAAAYCNFLSEKEGLTPAYDFSDWSCDWSASGYRLPTEAEWEYAARGGQEDTDPTGGDDNHKYAGSDEDTSLDDVAWYTDNSDAPGNSDFRYGKGTLPVGGKTPNELGLYDMTGNMWEWCWDWYDDGYYAESPGTNPRGPGSGSNRVVRGGSWFTKAKFCGFNYRLGIGPYVSSYHGFRPVLPAQVTVAVKQAPTARNDAALTNKDTPLEIEVLANDLDPDPGQSLIVAAATDGEHGTVQITGDGTTVTYTPGEGFTGTDSFTYTVSNQHGGTATAQVTVEVNRAPTPAADTAETTWETSVSIDVLANDTDPENDDLTLSAATQGNHGAVTLNGDTELTYTPNDTWLGEDQFSYTVVDEHGATATSQVTVTTVNQAPTARNDAAVANEDPHTPVEIDVLANDSDPNPGQSLIVASVTDGEHGTVEITGDGTTVTYTPGEGFTGTDSFTYTAGDPHGGTATAQVAMVPSVEGFVLVDGGTFTMGDTWDGYGYSREKPTHVVTVSSFHMSKYEATNQQVANVFQWAYDNGKLTADSSTVKNANGNSQELLDLDGDYCQISFSDGTFSVDDGKEDYPVVKITWYGAAAYCNFLSEKEGLTPAYDFSDWSCDWSASGYRLPTEAEWEYAARGGQADTDPGGDDDHKYAGSDENTSLDDVAWYSNNSGGHTHEVGTKTANELGLYDMGGNVWEWCWDSYDSEYYAKSPGTDPRGPGSGWTRVIRGGGWYARAGYCRVSNRRRTISIESGNASGFRPVLPAGQ